jgi:carbon monoxide dehydrogenase subunit G
MLIKDSFVINAPQEKVWDFLFDIPRLSQCIPGIESVEVVDERNYRGKLVVRVGPIKSAFSGVVTLTEVNAPNQIAGTVEGDDKASASSVKASFTGTLQAMDGGTKLHLKWKQTCAAGWRSSADPSSPRPLKS